MHHQIHEDGHQERKNRRAITHLGSVDAAVPSRAAMYQLIAENIEAIENKAENARRVTSLKRLRKRASGGIETLFPILKAFNPIMMLPERAEDIVVFQKQPDGA